MRLRKMVMSAAMSIAGVMTMNGCSSNDVDSDHMQPVEYQTRPVGPSGPVSPQNGLSGMDRSTGPTQR